MINRNIYSCILIAQCYQDSAVAHSMANLHACMILSNIIIALLAYFLSQL